MKFFFSSIEHDALSSRVPVNGDMDHMGTGMTFNILLFT
jgi:hypothetical protein